MLISSRYDRADAGLLYQLATRKTKHPYISLLSLKMTLFLRTQSLAVLHLNLHFFLFGDVATL